MTIPIIHRVSPTISIRANWVIIFGFAVRFVPHWSHGEILARIDVIVIQSEGAVKLYPSPKGSSSRQEIINLLLMAARTLAPSLLAWNVMEQLVLLHVFVRADVADYATSTRQRKSPWRSALVDEFSCIWEKSDWLRRRARTVIKYL